MTGERRTEFVSPLEVEGPTAPFHITSMDITGPYLMTPPKNKYLTFIDHLTGYVKAFAFPDQILETCQSICNPNYHSTWSVVCFFFQRDMQDIRNSPSQHF